MTAEYLLKQIINKGEIMRNLQKAFFQEKDSDNRKYLLSKSKTAEKDFDLLLQQAKQLIK